MKPVITIQLVSCREAGGKSNPYDLILMKVLLTQRFTLGLAWTVIWFCSAYPCSTHAGPWSSDSKYSERICPVHRIEMTVEPVEVLYGLPSLEFLEAYKSFRGGPGFVFGGCVVAESNYTQALTCAKCVAGYGQWMEEARVRHRERAPFMESEDAIEVSVGTDYAHFTATYRRISSDFFEELTMESVRKIFENNGISASGRVLRRHEGPVLKFEPVSMSEPDDAQKGGNAPAAERPQ